MLDVSIKMIMIVQAIFIFLLFKEAKLETLVQRTNCTEFPSNDHTNLAYTKWPYLVDCRTVFNQLDHFDAYSYEDPYIYDPEILSTIIKCEVSDVNDTIIYNVTTTAEEFLEIDGTIGYLIPDVQTFTSRELQIMIIIPEKELCAFEKVNINISAFPQETCQHFTSKQTILQIKTVEIEERKALLCEVEHEVYPKIHTDELIYHWQHNCSEDLPQNAVMNGQTLEFQSIEYRDAGIYTCSATYRNMTRFLSFYEFCVSDRWFYTKPTLTCISKTLYGKIGEDVLFECTANFGTGQPSLNNINFDWQKKQVGGYTVPKICRPSNELQTSDGLSCSYTFPSPNCFLYDVTTAKPDNVKADVQIQLRFRNINIFDYGEYLISTIANRRPIEAVNLSITLRDAAIVMPLPSNDWIIVITVCGAVLLVVMVIVVLRKQNVLSCKSKKSPPEFSNIGEVRTETDV